VVFVLPIAQDRKVNFALIASVIVLAWFAGLVHGAMQIVWSPYQKLVTRASNHQRGELGDFVVTVNNTGYQIMTDLSEARTAADPDLFRPELRGLSQYDLPLLFHPHPQRYLIVGAGAGNDASGALRHGVVHTTAVEIDPAIIALGRKYHP